MVWKKRKGFEVARGRQAQVDLHLHQEQRSCYTNVSQEIIA